MRRGSLPSYVFFQHRIQKVQVLHAVCQKSNSNSIQENADHLFVKAGIHQELAYLYIKISQPYKDQVG